MTCETVEMKIIARIHNGFRTKFGIPRQSGITGQTESFIVFEKEYRDENALRGIEDYSHLWLIWHFSESKKDGWSPTVRPPRLGGNRRMGVFATRSPYRPNPIGLSSVELSEVKKTAEYGTVLVVKGADLMDGTPIFDIKPYLAFSDSHENARNGFADSVKKYALQVELPTEVLQKLSPSEAEQLISLLSQDPRPSYKRAEGRVYGMKFGKFEVKFRADGEVLTVLSAEYEN